MTPHFPSVILTWITLAKYCPEMCQFTRMAMTGLNVSKRANSKISPVASLGKSAGRNDERKTIASKSISFWCEGQVVSGRGNCRQSDIWQWDKTPSSLLQRYGGTFHLRVISIQIFNIHNNNIIYFVKSGEKMYTAII